ncbi:MAG: hypothetical protein ACXWW8_07590 [Solirubrobacterales bacterium]
MPLRAVFVAAALALAAALASCGGGGDGSSGNDEEQIKQTIEAVNTTTNPDNCTELMTLRYAEQTEFEQGERALASCKTGSDDLDADSVETTGIEVSGEKATAEVAFVGAGFDGQSLAVSLLKQGDAWKLDQIDGFASFDRKKFLTAFEDAATRGQPSSTSKQVGCLTDALGKLPDDQLQKLFLSGDPNQFVKLLGPCLK